jgi:hypothetical protein
MPPRTRPIEKFAEATAKCAPEGIVYGKCVGSNFQNAKKDMCAKEFLALKDCYLVSDWSLIGLMIEYTRLRTDWVSSL